jgi:hypothetical protein
MILERGLTHRKARLLHRVIMWRESGGEAAMFAVAFLALYLAIPISLAIAALFDMWSKKLLAAKIAPRQDPRRGSGSR